MSDQYIACENDKRCNCARKEDVVPGFLKDQSAVTIAVYLHRLDTCTSYKHDNSHHQPLYKTSNTE